MREFRPRVVLVGSPGSGKTTVAAELARRWECLVRDTDVDVESSAGKPISEIFVDDGEPAFRELEAEAVARALDEHDGVLALGGGALLAEQTRSALRGHRVVFLDVGLAEAASRIGLGTTRPLLLGNVRAQLKAMLDQRRPVYMQVASVRIGTDGKTVAEVADAIEEAVSG